ncbi:MAG: AAA family ATPase [Eubacteriales bacterium]|jgi:stage III sporulation protein AA
MDVVDLYKQRERYHSAANLLPQRLRSAALGVEDRIKYSAEEFRLRIGRRFSINCSKFEHEPSPPTTITSDDLNALLKIATDGSVHTAGESLKRGYVTAKGGNRIGVCGSAVVKNGEVSSIINLSSASLRIAREIKDIGKEIYEELAGEPFFPNLLIVSPPGVGKTTLLRDLVRLISDGGRRVAVADERNELSGMVGGIPGFDIGRCTDVLEGCSKPEAVLMLLRSMSPQVIVMDEITSPEDMEAMERAANCGVSLLATAHAYSIEDLSQRVYYRSVSRLFDRVVRISTVNGSRSYELSKLSDWKSASRCGGDD